MKCIYWNARGLANAPTRLALKRMLAEYSPDFCFLAEPWLSVNRFPNNWFNRLNLKIFAVNNRGPDEPNLWCICSKHIDPTMVLVDDQHISFTVNDNGNNIGFSVIYASTNYIKRRMLWKSLSVIHNMPWTYIGDFNTTSGAHEYRGSFLLLSFLWRSSSVGLILIA